MSVPASAQQTHGEARAKSPLLEKICHLGLQVPLDLERLAVARGCRYYERDLGVRVPPLGAAPISDAELAIALIAPSLPPTAREIRLAACILGTPDIALDEVATLAIQEGCADLVAYIAACGHQYEPDNPFWTALIAHLPQVILKGKGWPHPTRFVEMTGIVRGKVGLFTRWIRPRAPVPA
jgi:hypothetical protein